MADTCAWRHRASSMPVSPVVEQKQNLMAHAQKLDLVFQRNGRVHLYRRGCQFSRLLAAEVCGSAVVMLDRPCTIVHDCAGYPLHSPFSPSLLHPYVSVCHQIPFLLYWMITVLNNWLDSLTEFVLHRVKEERNVLSKLRRKKANSIGHILYRNCLLEHVIEGKIEGRSDRKTRKKT